MIGAAPAYAFKARALEKRVGSSPSSASSRLPVSWPSPGKLVMISALSCWSNASMAACASWSAAVHRGVELQDQRLALSAEGGLHLLWVTHLWGAKGVVEPVNPPVDVCGGVRP